MFRVSDISRHRTVSFFWPAHIITAQAIPDCLSQVETRLELVDSINKCAFSVSQLSSIDIAHTVRSFIRSVTSAVSQSQFTNILILHITIYGEWSVSIVYDAISNVGCLRIGPICLHIIHTRVFSNLDVCL